ncbi:hypothetical protein [Aquisphaera insulae]|uniref:hypothetical protein n=1 Tax=Aquisphaera insulae TaxID=2712864 RepID=UPI0013ED9703|nr:hypothetical protein [Aquisphaera insulae]
MSTTRSRPRPEPSNGDDPGAAPAAGPPSAADPFTAAASLWAQWLEQSARGTQALLEAFGTAADPQKFQQRWLDALSQSFETFMRTPAYLELMKDTLKGVIQLKVAQDQAITDTARQLGLPLAADITGLFERLHGTEQAILRRLDVIEERLSAIDSR